MTEQARFYKRAEDWLHRLMELNPVSATQLGEHRWDDKLGDNSPEGLESQAEELRSAVIEFQAMDTASFTLEAEIDHTLVLKIFESFVRSFDKAQGYRRNPGGYLDEVMGGIVLLLMKEFAPLPERLKSVLGRVREAPRVCCSGAKCGPSSPAGSP